MKKQKKTGLGRGVASLIPEIGDTGDYSTDTLFQCPIDDIKPNRYQPRITFSDEELEKLKESIIEQGVIQPLLVRNLDGSYELIAGERRLRAAKLANLNHVPVFVKNLTDEQALEVAIIENVQREDLNPLEEADAYQRLVSEFHYTQEMVAKKIGKNRSTIANLLRLRGLPDQIKASLVAKKISMGHARSILGAGSEDEQLDVWQLVVAKKLSVRETEKFIHSIKKQLSELKIKKVSPEKIFLTELSAKLTQKLNSKIKISKQGEKGKVEIKFKNQKEFDHIIELLNQAS
ncbi:MAG: ParB/RepB/Spo0J family partition protein [Desulfobacteraceae bacterium]|nr:ParB/RepB/Spo0J family partition protein [Desulfobacteraceae bacterium]